MNPQVGPTLRRPTRLSRTFYWAVDGGPPGGVRAEGLGATTINAKKRRRRAPGGARAGGPGAPTINAKKRQ
jgi:hypothetical protein